MQIAIAYLHLRPATYERGRASDPRSPARRSVFFPNRSGRPAAVRAAGVCGDAPAGPTSGANNVQT